MWEKFKNFLKTNSKSLFVCTMISFFLVFSYNAYLSQMSQEIRTIPYTEFMQLVNENKVDSIHYNTGNEWMTITVKNNDTKNMSSPDRLKYEGYTNADRRRVLYPSSDTFRREMVEKDINMVVVSQSSSILEIVFSLLSTLFPILLIVYMFRMIATQVGNTNAKDIIVNSDVKFSDIIGHDEILDDVKFITELIKDPTIGDKVGATVPKGILFSGDPGTGKTLLAKAIAGEAGVPFLYQNASSLIDRYVGMGAKHVRDLFKIAKANAPCIIFLDEIDAIGGDRDSGKGTSENDQTINALLQEMDGFNSRKGIFVIAATNRPDILDKALKRAGRFDREIVVPAPKDWHVRYDLFEHYLSKFSISDDIDIENISKQTSGFTGADIAAICNEASIIAVMAKKPCIDYACIEEAIDKKVFHGNRSKKEQYVHDKEIVAYHEAGHAVVNYLLGEPIARASIQSTISGVGGAVFNQDKDSCFQTDKDFKNRVLVCYGGRASEQIKFGDVTTGASNDITQATNILKLYVERFGFDKDFGLLDMSVLTKEHLVNTSDISKKLGKMSNELYEQCLNILRANYGLVELLAQKLLDVETLTGDQITELFASVNCVTY